MIKKLRLKGWRSHWDSELEFSEGTNALIGVMGAGKTSVMDAISFALFGTFPSLQTRRLTIEDVVMKRPIRAQKAEVLLEFENDGSSYTIKRTIERGGVRNAEIRKDGRLLDSGITKVNDVVERVLKTNYDLFSRAVYAEQNGLDYFLTIPKGQRMKRIDELLHIDRFEAARTTCKTVINRIADSTRDKSVFLREMESGGELSRIELLAQQIEASERARRELRDKENECIKKEQVVEEELNVVRTKEVEIRSLDVQVARLQGTIKALEAETSVSAKPIEQLQNRVTELQKAYGVADQRVREAENKRLGEEKIKQRLEIVLEECRKQITQLESIGSSCPVCEQPMNEEHRQKHLGEKKTHSEELSHNIIKAVQNVDKAAEELENVRELRENVREERSRVEKELMLTKQLENKRALLTDQKRLLADAEQRRSGLKMELEGVSLDEKQEVLRHISSELAALRAELRALENSLGERYEEMKRLHEHKMLFEKYKGQIKQMESLSEDMKKFYVALEQTQLALRREFIEAVNATMSKLWDTLYPYEDYMSVRLGVREDYVLELRENGGEWVPVEGVASGGERTTALLALRMAFALVLTPNLRWLVLDEPTHNLDSNAVEQLAEVLRDHIGDYVDQVFLITHDEKLENAVTGFLYKLEREREKNESTRVVRVLSPYELEAAVSV